jgi:ABC-type nitrate/sulfonate/bicarbonate transport system substrate-binding protein
MFVLVQLTACGSAAPANDTADKTGASDEPFTLRVYTPTNYVEFVIADALGFFADEGIKLEYVGALGKGVTEFQLLEQGEVDAFLGGHPPGVAQARLAGIKARSVCPAMIDDPDNNHITYIVKADSPIQTLDEAIGKKVSIASFSPCTSGYIQYYLKSQGLDQNGAELVVMADIDATQALDQGLIDIVASHPPYAGLAVQKGVARKISSSWDLFHSAGAGLAVRGFTDDFIAKHPDVVQGFVNAEYRARVWVNAHPDETKGILGDFMGLDPQDLSIFVFDERKNIAAADIDQWFTIAEEIELWQPGEIEPQDVYTNDFVPADIPASDADLHWGGPGSVTYNKRK